MNLHVKTGPETHGFCRRNPRYFKLQHSSTQQTQHTDTTAAYDKLAVQQPNEAETPHGACHHRDPGDCEQNNKPCPWVSEICSTYNERRPLACWRPHGQGLFYCSQSHGSRWWQAPCEFVVCRSGVCVCCVLLFEIPGVSTATAVRFWFCFYVQIRIAWHVRASSPEPDVLWSCNVTTIQHEDRLMCPRSITVRHFVRHMLLRLAEVGRRSCRR